VAAIAAHILAMVDPLGHGRHPAPTLPLTPPEATPNRRPAIPTVTAKGGIKATVVLNAEELVAIDVPHGEPRLKLTVRIPGQKGVGSAILVGLNAKSARRSIASIRELGPNNVAAFVQGKMVGNLLAEAGLMVVAKTKKPEDPEPAEVAVPPFPAAA
jgi:hypothetical protein